MWQSGRYLDLKWNTQVMSHSRLSHFIELLVFDAQLDECNACEKLMLFD